MTPHDELLAARNMARENAKCIAARNEGARFGADGLPLKWNPQQHYGIGQTGRARRT